MAQIAIPNFSGVSTAVELPNANGRASAANSRPAVLSTEDLAALTALGTKLDSLLTIAGATTDSPVSVHQPADVLTFVPTLDTSIYAAGDVLFATVALAGVTRASDGCANLVSLTAIDKSKQKPAMTLFFYQTNVTSAAANAANNLSDADAINCLGYVSIAAADWKDLANNSFLTYSGAKAPNLLLKAASGTSTVYVVGILDAGTPTFALADLMIRLGVVQA